MTYGLHFVRHNSDVTLAVHQTERQWTWANK